MKKTIILVSAVCLLITFSNVRPAQAIDPLGAGVAIGVGASMLVGGLINSHNYHHTAYVPAPVHQSYGYYEPPPVYHGGSAYGTPYYGHSRTYHRPAHYGHSGYYHRPAHYGHGGYYHRPVHYGHAGYHHRPGSHHYRPRY